MHFSPYSKLLYYSLAFITTNYSICLYKIVINITRFISVASYTITHEPTCKLPFVLTLGINLVTDWRVFAKCLFLTRLITQLCFYFITKYFYFTKVV